MPRNSAWLVCGACGKEAYADPQLGACDPCMMKPENQPVWFYNSTRLGLGLRNVDELELAVQQILDATLPGSIIKVQSASAGPLTVKVHMHDSSPGELWNYCEARAPIPAGSLVCLDHNGFVVPTYCHPTGISIGKVVD